MEISPKRKGISLSLSKSNKNNTSLQNQSKPFHTFKSTSLSSHSHQLHAPPPSFSSTLKIGSKEFISVQLEKNTKRNFVQTIPQEFINLNNIPYQGQKPKIILPSYTSCELENIPFHSVADQNKKIIKTNTSRCSLGSAPKTLVYNTISFAPHEENMKLFHRNMGMFGEIENQNRLYTRRVSFNSVIPNNMNELMNERKNIGCDKLQNDPCKVLRDIGNRLDELIDLTKS